MKSSVTVIIPVYNRRRVLARAVRSVLAQSRIPDKVVIVDDASSIPIKAYLATEKLLSERVILVRNEENLGGAGARNVGAEMAETDLIAFLDSDDYWLPEKIVRQMGVFESDPSVGMVCCDAQRFNKNGEPRPSDRTFFDDCVWDRLIDGWSSFPNTSSLMLRKDVFDDVGGFDPELTSCQDHDLWMRVGQSGTRVHSILEPLYVTAGGSTHRITSDYELRAGGVERFLSKWGGVVESERGSLHARRFARRYIANTMMPIFVMRMLNRHWAGAWEVYRKYFLLNPFFFSEIAKMVNAAVRRRYF